MKRIILVIYLTGILHVCAFCQTDISKYDTAFLHIFSVIAFQNTSANLPILRRWNQNIRIYMEGVELEDDQKAIRSSLNIKRIQSLLNGITIEWVMNKNDANYLIQLDTAGINHYYLSYDRDGNIFNCRVTINKKKSFSAGYQIKLIRNYFLTSLGHFYFPKNISYPGLNSCLYSLINEMSPFDEKVISLEYSKQLRTGMSNREFLGMISR